MTFIADTGSPRNTHDQFADLPLFKFRPTPSPETLTPGAREIYRRTGWSLPLCRTVAHLAGFAEVEAH